mgnify:CR=1 FL=1|jgi:mono/diheme cytochrome c family protein
MVIVMNTYGETEMKTQARFKIGLVALCFLVMIVWTVAPLWAACPQPRNTQKAPNEFYNMVNPLKPTIENILEGKGLFEEKAKPLACKNCHGINGDGKGIMASGLTPPPREFTCAKTIDGVPDGQLFWIIKNGSPGTGMPSFRGHLEDTQVWQLILYVRKLAQTRIALITGIANQNL